MTIKDSNNYFFISTSTREYFVVVVVQVQTFCCYLGVRLLVNKTLNGITEWTHHSARQVFVHYRMDSLPEISQHVIKKLAREIPGLDCGWIKKSQKRKNFKFEV